MRREGGRGIRDVLEDIDHDHRVAACGLERQLFDAPSTTVSQLDSRAIRDIALEVSTPSTA